MKFPKKLSLRKSDKSGYQVHILAGSAWILAKNGNVTGSTQGLVGTGNIHATKCNCGTGKAQHEIVTSAMPLYNTFPTTQNLEDNT